MYLHSVDYQTEHGILNVNRDKQNNEEYNGSRLRNVCVIIRLTPMRKRDATLLETPL